MKNIMENKRNLVIAIAVFAVTFISIYNASTSHVTVSKSGITAGYTLDDLMLKSDLVIDGTVTEKSAPFKVKPTNGSDETVFTDYTVRVNEIYRSNEDEPIETLTIRIDCKFRG